MSLNPLVGIQPQQPTQDVASCLAQINEALQQAQTIGATDKRNIYFLLNSLVVPFDDQGMTTASIFKTQDSDFSKENDDFRNPITDAVDQISSTVNNPLSGILGSQGQLFNSSLTSLLGAGSNNILTSVFDKVQAALRSFFLLGSQSDSNLAGLLLFAIEENMPVMANTESYVKQMETLTKQIMEGCSKLPPTFIPEIPNLVVIRNLCDADAQLNKVVAEITQFQTLDLATLANASAKVCKSRDIVKSGVIAAEDLPLIQSVFGLTDLQINQVATSRFTPDPSFRLKLDKLATLNQFVQENSSNISSLNNNLLGLLNTLSNVDSLGIGSIIQIMIVAIQEQITNVRSRLESEAVNFIKQNGFSVPNRIVTENNVGTTIYDPSQIQTFLDQTNTTMKILQTYSTVINNAETFAELSALCIVLGRVNGMYQSILKIMKQQSAILLALKKFVNQHISKACQTKDASGIDLLVKSFIDAATARLTGIAGTNDTVMTQGQALLTELKLYKGSVGCIHSSVTAGRIDITLVLNNIPGNPGHAPTSVGNIQDLLRFMPQLKDALKTLDLKRITGVEAKEYDALTKLLDGLQCLAANCNNSFVRDTSRQYIVRFQKELAKRASIAITTASMQEVPARAFKANVDHRYKKTQDDLKTLKTFANSNLPVACKPVDNMRAITQADVLVHIGGGSAGTATGAATGAATTRLQQAQREEDSRDAALAAQTPLSNRLI